MRLFRAIPLRLRLSPTLVLLVTILWLVGRATEALTLFGIVFLHELAHALVAVRHGIRIERIELSPIGGVARIDALLEFDPGLDQRIAIAGPVCNLLLALIGWLLLPHAAAAESWLRFFIQSNLALGGFNLLPALPLDGGRIYRARLARNVGFRQAAQQTVRLSKAIALILFVVGIVGVLVGALSATLMVLAGFIYFTASRVQSDAAYIFMRYLTTKSDELKQRRSMPVEELVARPDTPVKEVVEQFVPQRYHMVWVVDEKGGVRGLATEAQVLAAWFERGIDTPMALIVERREA